MNLTLTLLLKKECFEGSDHQELTGKGLKLVLFLSCGFLRTHLGGPFRILSSMLDYLGRGSEGNTLRIFNSLGSQLSRSVSLHVMLVFLLLLKE